MGIAHSYQEVTKPKQVKKETFLLNNNIKTIHFAIYMYLYHGVLLIICCLQVLTPTGQPISQVACGANFSAALSGLSS